MANVFDNVEGREWLKSVLRNEGAEITFTKADGTERVLKATLNESEIPADFVPKASGRAKSDEALAVFDVEAQGWRSFRWDSVKSVAFSLGQEE